MSSTKESKQRSTDTTDMTTTTTPTGIEGYQGQFDQGYGNLMSLFGNRVSQPLNLEKAPIFSEGFDPIVANTFSKGVQDIKSRETAANKATSNALNVEGTGNNSALLTALNRQSKIGSAGAMNSLYPAQLEQQRATDLQRQAMLQARNQEALTARAQLVNELTPGMGLLQTLQQMAQTSRGEKKRTSGTTTSNTGARTSSGGIF